MPTAVFSFLPHFLPDIGLSLSDMSCGHSWDFLCVQCENKAMELFKVGKPYETLNERTIKLVVTADWSRAHR
nr:hypothetical protein BgiMline_005135 [Biomphalaria glabrata]